MSVAIDSWIYHALNEKAKFSMRQEPDRLLDEIQFLMAKMSRVAEENEYKNQAISLLLKSHRLLALCRDDGLGPYEISKSDRALYPESDQHSLKHALNKVALAIEASKFSRLRSSESDFYALLV